MPGVVTVPARFVYETEWALKMSHREFAELVGVSRRTIIRWEQRGALIPSVTMRKLEGALDAVSPALAAECRTLLSQDPTVPASHATVDAVLQAAATSLGISPDTVRPAVEAAFQTAQSRGVSVQGMVLALAPHA
jgi:transcriptional regulator with XRE-family HTH domain